MPLCKHKPGCNNALLMKLFQNADLRKIVHFISWIYFNLLINTDLIFVPRFLSLAFSYTGLHLLEGINGFLLFSKCFSINEGHIISFVHLSITSHHSFVQTLLRASLVSFQFSFGFISLGSRSSWSWWSNNITPLWLYKGHYSQKNHCNDNCNDFSD